MIDIEDIKRFAENDKIAFKTHAIFRMKERTIFADEIKEILINGEIIAEYKDDFPLPSCLILGLTESKKKIHAVVAVDKKIEMLWIITLYEPTLEVWKKGFRKRRIKK